MQRIFQAAAWLLAGIIVVLSLSPASVRPTTGAQHDLEHLLIFLATGMAFGFGYPDRFRLLTIALPTFAAAIEVAQIWAPGCQAVCPIGCLMGVQTVPTKPAVCTNYCMCRGAGSVPP